MLCAKGDALYQVEGCLDGGRSWCMQCHDQILTCDVDPAPRDFPRIWKRDDAPQIFNTSMLSRRIFRQLTDSFLLSPSTAPVRSVCLATNCSPKCVQQYRNPCSNRHASSSSTRWKSRQGRDFYAKEAKVQGLKSRAAFKILEACGMNDGRGCCR
jgi:hypothetical protein